MKMEEKKYPPDMDGLVFSKEAFSQDKPNYNGTEKSKSQLVIFVLLYLSLG
jgi:hypothetical protein